MRKNSKFIDILERIINIIFMICGLFSVAMVLIITIYLVISGIPAIKEIGLINFIFGKVWASTAAEPSYGILPFILTSIYGTCGSIIIGVPLGFYCSVFISKIVNKKIRTILEMIIDLLASLPSVVLGLVGMMCLVPTVRKIFNLADGSNLLSAIIVLTIIILPNIIKVSLTSLDAVPEEYEQGSLALGANEIETYLKVSVPASKSGILSAIILGVGRALGEAMAIIMVSGNVANMPSLFASVRFLTTAVASEMSYASGLQREALFSIALVLFVFIMMINAFFEYLLGDKKNAQ